MRYRTIFQMIISFLPNICFGGEPQSPVDGNEITTSSSDSDKMVKVEVQGKSEKVLARADPLSKSVVSNTDLMKFGDSTVVEALRRLPGVLVIGNQVQLTGFDGNRTQVLVDGKSRPGVPISELPLITIDRVEIFRRGNAEFSSQASGGTINIILKNIPKRSENQIKLAVAHAYRASGNFDILTSDKVDDLSYSVSVSGGETGALSSMPVFTSTTVYNHLNDIYQDYRQVSSRSAKNTSLRISPRLKYKVSELTDISLSSTIGGTHRNSDQNETYNFIIGAPLAVANFDQLLNSRNYLGNILLDVKSKFEGGRTLELGFGLDGARSRSRTFERTFDVIDSPLFSRNRVSRSRNINLSSTGKYSFPINAKNQFSIGWELSTKRNNWDRTQVPEQVLSQTKELDQETESRIRRADFFMQNDWVINKAVSAYLGARSETVITEALEDKLDSRKNRTQNLSPVAQLMWQLNDENTDRVRFSLTRTYQLPTDEQLLSPRWSNINNTIQTPNLRGNPDLLPEVAWAVDVGYEYNGKSGFNLSVFAKYRKISDLIRETLSLAEGEWWLSYINAGAATSKSLEFESQFPLKSLWKTDANVDFSLSISKTWSRVDFLDGPFNSLSPNSFSSNASVDYTSGKLPLNAGVSASYTSSDWQRVNMNRYQNFEIPLDVSTYATWKFNKNIQLRAAVGNLLKRRFVLKSANTYDDKIGYYNLFSPADRRFTLSLEVKI